MKTTFVKTASAAVLTATLLVSSYTPVANEAVSAKTNEAVKKDVQRTTQIKTITASKVYATYADAKKDKAVHTLPVGSYVKKMDTVEVKGKKYYSITYSNAYAIQSQKDFNTTFKVLTCYMKVANTEKEAITIKGYNSLFSDFQDDAAYKKQLGTTTRYIVLDNSVSYLSSARFDDFEYPNHFIFIEKGTILTAVDTFTINNQRYYAKNYGLMQSIIPATAIKKVTTSAKVYTAAERKVMYHVTQNTVSRKSFGKQADTLNKIKAGTKVQRLKEVTADGNKYVFVKINYSKKQLDEGYTPYGWILKDRIKKVK